MSRSIEQALLSLMPTHGSELPPTLVNTAGSLLAQSRHRASTLKTEEEVARLYACCHIACDRLKISLNLPPIEPRPPIPPRIYKRLYTHLDNILPKSAGARTPSKVGTPRSKVAQSTPTSARPLPSRVTPGRDSALAPFRSDAERTPSKSTGKKSVAIASRSGRLPSWVHPTIRFMARETGNTNLAPSVLAGMEAIVVPFGRRTGDEWIWANLTALCGALYFFVVQQIRKLDTGREVTQDIYIPARKEIMGLLARARDELSTLKSLQDEDAWEGWQVLKTKDFDAAVGTVTDRNWLEGDWFRGLGDVAALAASQYKDASSWNEEEEEEEEDQARKDVTRPAARRADTMFQDKYDYLSEERRRDYRIWKERILQRITQLETEGSSRMDVDP